ncbi:MAG: type 4a pilus biogenesis protein PilO [Bdellovibrionaceae bacterium]|nr:type 4a pilus biogenesis protein PilO [Pseudobdellovibrionaceae bacterium]
MSEVSPAIEKLSSLTNQQLVIGSIIIAALYYMLMYDDGTRLENAIATTKTSIQTYQAQLQEYQKAEEEAKAFKLALDQEGPKFDAIVKFMPVELSEFEVLEILSTEVKAAGGRVKSSNAVREKTEGEQIYNKIEAKLGLEITYSQFLLFLSYITKVDKIISLKEVSFSRKNEELDGEMLLTVDATFIAYQYKPKEVGADGSQN